MTSAGILNKVYKVGFSLCVPSHTKCSCHALIRRLFTDYYIHKYADFIAIWGVL